MARKRRKSRRKPSFSAGSRGQSGGEASTSTNNSHATTSNKSVGSQNNNNDSTSDETDDGDHASSSSDFPIWHYFDIEPILILHVMAAMMIQIGSSQVMVEKACMVDLKLGDGACTALQTNASKRLYKGEEEQVQKLLSSLYMWRTIIENLLPVVLVCQIGAWSDKHGRKLPMLMVILTFILNYAFLAVSSHYRTRTGAWHMGLGSSAIKSLAGNNACFSAVVVSHIADVTPKHMLSLRTSIRGSCYFIGILVGLSLGGYTQKMMSPTTVFALAASIEVLNFLGLLILLKRKRLKESKWAQAQDLLSSRYIKESIHSVTKRRPDHGREMLFLLLACHVITLAPLVGESSVDALAARYRWEWDAPAYSRFIRYKTIMGFLGSFLCMGLLHGLLHLSDPVVGIISCLGLMAAAIIAAFAKSAKWYYVGPIASILSGSVLAVPRSIMFRFIPATERGKINSFIGSLESLTPLIFSPIYTFIYVHTFRVFPGAYYLLSALLITFPIWAYIWILTNRHKID